MVARYEGTRRPKKKRYYNFSAKLEATEVSKCAFSKQDHHQSQRSFDDVKYRVLCLRNQVPNRDWWIGLPVVQKVSRVSRVLQQYQVIR
jgi:hypothetical protein